MSASRVLLSLLPPKDPLSESCSCFMAGRQLVKRQRLQGPNRGCGFWFVVWAERRGVSLGAIRRPRRMLRPPSLRLPVRLADAFGARWPRQLFGPVWIGREGGVDANWGVAEPASRGGRRVLFPDAAYE